MSKHHFDIINSPEAETFLRMVTKGFYDNSYTGLWMYETIGQEWDEMRKWAEGLKNEINPQTCTWSIGIWEWVYGIETDETLQLEYRRQRILAKILGTKPINPEAIRRGVARITGCDVDITDFVGPYRFDLKVHMLEDENTPSYQSVREYIRTAKPSHLAVFLDWVFQIIIDSTQLEQFLNLWVRLHWFIPFWDCYVFDGTWNLNGNVQLCQHRRYDLRMGLKYYEGIFYELAVLHTKLFDGTWNLDGSVGLDAEYHSFRMQIYGKIKNEIKVARLSVKEVFRLVIDFWNLHASRYQMEAKVRTHIAVSSQTEKIKDESVEIRRNLWFLDGTLDMSGSRILNAMYRKEML